MWKRGSRFGGINDHYWDLFSLTGLVIIYGAQGEFYSQRTSLDII